MKVSLSASSGGCKEAEVLLATCDLIYTTQWFHIEALREDYPNAIIKPLPDCCPDLIEFLKERHKDDEVIGLGDLMELRNKKSEN